LEEIKKQKGLWGKNMALPSNRNSFKNLFPDIVVDDMPMQDLWRAWQISQEYKDKVKILDTYFLEENDRWDTIAEDVYGDRALWWILPFFNELEDPFSIYFQKDSTVGLKTIKIIRPADVGILLKVIRDNRLKFET
jgi:hypothetical protein